MNIDFLDAHERHWEDAEILLQNQRLANADHLYGMSAECGLKRLMISFGMKVLIDGKPKERADWVHADQAWQRFDTYRAGHHVGAAYVLPAPNPFADWNVSQRYAQRSDFDHLRVEAHRNGVETVRLLIRNAQKDGLI